MWEVWVGCEKEFECMMVHVHTCMQALKSQ